MKTVFLYSIFKSTYSLAKKNPIMKFVIHESVPTVEEYCAMRLKAGLSPRSVKTASIALPNSLYAISIRYNNILVAMGRVVGDGACNFEVVDIAVDPHYQGQGLGRQIMKYIDDYLAFATFEDSYVSMIADKPEFYEKLGYQPVAPKSQGMTKKFLKQNA